jgi:HTH-type transcriptional regulator, sugar sensing transcriptional regulator
MMEEKIINVLRSLGLSKNEVTVYLDIVSFKTSSALNISKRTKLHRANTYDALKKLIMRGFVTEVIKDNKKLFRALEFEKLRFYIKQKEKEIEEIIPLMKELHSEETDKKEEVILSKGIFSFRNTLMSSLEHSRKIEIYGAPKNFVEVIGEGFFKEFDKIRAKNRIPLKLIFKRKPENFEELNKLSLVEVGYTGLSTNSLAIICIFDEEIVMAVPMDLFSIITIKSKEIAGSYRDYFSAIWEQAEK